MWPGSGLQGVLDQTIVKRLWESREDQSVSMDISIHLPEHTCLDTLLPVSEHTRPVFLPLSPFLFLLEIKGMRWRSKAIWPIPYPYRIGKRCPGVTCLLIVYLRACESQLWATCSIICWAKKTKKKGLGSQSSKYGSLPTTHSPRHFSPHPHPALRGTSYFSVTNSGPWMLACCLFWVKKGFRRRWTDPAGGHMQNLNHVHL